MMWVGRVHDCQLFALFYVALRGKDQLAVAIVVAVPDDRIARVVEPGGD